MPPRKVSAGRWNRSKVGNRIGDIGAAVEGYVSQFGYSVVRKYVGHGVGHELHESPDVPNFGTPGTRAAYLLRHDACH